MNAGDPVPGFSAARPWLDQLQEGIVLHGESGGILAYTAPAARLLGVGPTELAGHATLFPSLEVTTVEGEPLRPEDEPVWEALRRGEPGPARVVRVRRAGGAEDWLSLRWALLPAGAPGDATHPLTVIADAGERREREQALADGRREVAMGRMAGHVAHDVHNLLTVILGWSDVLLESLPAHGPAWRQAREIRGASERGARIAGRLLAVGRGESIEPVRVDVHRLLEELHPTLSRVAGDPLEVRLDLHACRSIVSAEPGGIEQVLLNLVSNARDASPAGGRVSVSTREAKLDDGFADGHPGASEGPHLVIAVVDEGTGMDEATRGRAFEPFFTTRADRGGLGLGLSIVRTVVQQANGWIDVETHPGAGTTVSVYLPLAGAAGDAPATAVSESRQSAPVGGP